MAAEDPRGRRPGGDRGPARRLVAREGLEDEDVSDAALLEAERRRLRPPPTQLGTPRAPEQLALIDLSEEEREDAEVIRRREAPLPPPPALSEAEREEAKELRKQRFIPAPAAAAAPGLRLDPATVPEWRALAWDPQGRYRLRETLQLGRGKLGKGSPAKTIPEGTELVPSVPEDAEVLRALGLDPKGAPFTALAGRAGEAPLKAALWAQLSLADRETVRRKQLPGETLAERTAKLKKVEEMLADVDRRVSNKASFISALLFVSAEDTTTREAAKRIWDAGPETRRAVLLEELYEAEAQLSRQVLGDYYRPRHTVDAPAPSSATIKTLGVRPVNHAPKSPDAPDKKSQRRGVENILKVLRAARPEEIMYWRDWYMHANEDAMQLSRRYRVPRSVAAAVIAAVSPNTPWEKNIRAAEQILRGAGAQVVAARMVGDVLAEQDPTYRFWPELLPHTPQKVGTRVYLDNIKKAQLILDAWKTSQVFPEEANETRLAWPVSEAETYRQRLLDYTRRGWLVKGGSPDWSEMREVEPSALESVAAFAQAFPKRRSSRKRNAPMEQRAIVVPPLGDKDDGARKVNTFFASIQNPAATQDRVVVDGHAMNIFRGTRERLDKVGAIHPVTSQAVESAYAEAARRSPEVLREKGLDPTPLTPQQVQAVTWSIWRAVVKDDEDEDESSAKTARIALDMSDADDQNPMETMYSCYRDGALYSTGTLDEVAELVEGLGMTTVDVPPAGALIVRGQGLVDTLEVRGRGGLPLTEDDELRLLEAFDLPPTGTEGA